MKHFQFNVHIIVLTRSSFSIPKTIIPKHAIWRWHYKMLYQSEVQVYNMRAFSKDISFISEEIRFSFLPYLNCAGEYLLIMNFRIANHSNEKICVYRRFCSWFQLECRHNWNIDLLFILLWLFIGPCGNFDQVKAAVTPFLVQPLHKQSIRVLNGFSSWRLQWMTVLSMLIRGITAGDWHILSCYVTLFWLRVHFDKSFCPVNVRTHQNEDSNLKHNCDVMNV